MKVELRDHRGEPFGTSRARYDGTVVIEAHGEIDHMTATALDRELSAAACEGLGAVVLDLCDVGFMDSSGIATLLRQRESFRASGIRLLVACPPGGGPRLAVDVSGVKSFFELYDTADEALEAAR